MTSSFSKTTVSFISHSTKDLQEIPLENSCSCKRYFLKMKHKSTKTTTQRCLSCQNKSLRQKPPRSRKKQKSAPNAIYTLFALKTIIVSNPHYHSKKYILISEMVNKKKEKRGDSQLNISYTEMSTYLTNQSKFLK